jgi:uncharacterized protein GlcG (DUF336 family)
MLNLNEARRVARAAEERARQLGCAVHIAVVDENGQIVVTARMDGAWLAGADAAMSKAYTARAFDSATRDLIEYTRYGGEFSGIQLGNSKRLTTAPGGVLLSRNGRIAGAIGVSGWAASEDETIAMAGARAFSDPTTEERPYQNWEWERREWERRNSPPSHIAQLGTRGPAETQTYRQSPVQ